MKNALGIAAFNIEDLMVDDLGHGGPLPDLIGAGGHIPCDAVHDHF